MNSEWSYIWLAAVIILQRGWSDFVKGMAFPSPWHFLDLMACPQYSRVGVTAACFGADSSEGQETC
jgi:hypothetical protein